MEYMERHFVCLPWCIGHILEDAVLWLFLEEELDGSQECFTRTALGLDIDAGLMAKHRKVLARGSSNEEVEGWDFLRPAVDV